MKKLFVLSLLCLPLVCHGQIKVGKAKKGPSRAKFASTWSSRKPRFSIVMDGKTSSKPSAYTPSKLSRAVAEKTHFSAYTRNLHRAVLTAAQNTAVLMGHKKERSYYGKPYVAGLRSSLEEIKNPVLRKMEEHGKATFGIASWTPYSINAALIASKDLPYFLFNARDGEKLFGPALLIKDKEGVVATAVPTKIPITLIGGEYAKVKPFTYITIAMHSPDRLPREATVYDAFQMKNANSLAFHSIEVGKIDNIRDYAFTAEDMMSYALDSQSTLFSKIDKHGDGLTGVARQNILISQNGAIQVIEKGKTVTIMSAGHGIEKPVVILGAKSYDAFKNDVLKEVSESVRHQ